MNRNRMLSEIADPSIIWDIAIVGGGATGVGVAIEAASRGYKVILCEQSDFGKATSSRSTKLAHGGVRYLQQGNISLVLEALKERGIMRKNAPHLVHDLPFIVPVYDWWEGPFYGIGLKIYDMLAGKEGFGSSRNLSKEETIKLIPTVETEGLDGGVIYYDGQFDDARLLINMVQTAIEQGAIMANYMKVTQLVKDSDQIDGFEVQDEETGKLYNIKAKVVINATGVFSDSVRKMDDPDAENIMTSSQGVHLVLDKSFLPGNSAIMVPHTEDGRVLFAVPWYNRTLIGTTETYIEDYKLEPIPQQQEIDFLLNHAAKYLTKDPEKKDIKSVFVGLRPLVKGHSSSKETASISRDHTITISKSGLISISGGKWTTYRKMAEDVIEQAVDIADLDYQSSVTKSLQIHGYHHNSSQYGQLAHYGSDARKILDLCNEKTEYNEFLHLEYKIKVGELIWSIRNEMTRTIDDFLARRTRLLFLDAKASIEIAPKVAEIMKNELKFDQEWVNNQINSYLLLARNYIIE